jgi:hypothetical protein
MSEGLNKLPLGELVERAHNEIDALCNGKRWRMCIPVQGDDSDIILGEALRAQEKEILRLRNALTRIANSDGPRNITTGEGHSECVWAARKALAWRAENT